MDGALLVAGHDVGHRVLALGRRDLVLQQGLADAGDVAVTEDAECARDEAALDAVALGVLVGQEANDCLCDRQAHGSPVGFVAHGWSFRELSYLFMGRRGSTSWCSQVARIQWWAGSSGASHTRSSFGPAMTLR